MAEKKTERVTVWLPETLAIELMRLAHNDDRKLSEFITLALSRYVYGHSRRADESCDVAISGDTPQ
jgi:metal-responsive CopG/Arc/MetJ family transcriptional regulator